MRLNVFDSLLFSSPFFFFLTIYKWFFFGFWGQHTREVTQKVKDSLTLLCFRVEKRHDTVGKQSNLIVIVRKNIKTSSNCNLMRKSLFGMEINRY
jgi:hypothetical protein